MTDPVLLLKKTVVRIGRLILKRPSPTRSKEELRLARKEAIRRARKEAKRYERRASPHLHLVVESPNHPVVEPPKIPVIDSLPSKWSGTQSDLKGQRREFRSLARRYSQVITSVTSANEGGWLTPGRSDWAAKWRNCTGRRILFFAYVDYSGSFYKWAEAVNRHTAHAVRMVSVRDHRYGYPLDILTMPSDLLVSRFPEMLHALLQLIDEADVVHLKDQTGFLMGRNGLPKALISQFKKPTVYTLYGGTARQDETDRTFQRYVQSHAAVTAMTPDLCFEWCRSKFIPHNIDEEAYPFSWRDGLSILHTPSTVARKGTEFFRPAAERLAAEIGGEVNIVTDTKHQYVMSRKPEATLFFDQAGREQEIHGGKVIGWYGNSALEAAVFGVPTMAHLSQEAIERADKAGFNVQTCSALLNVEPTEASMYATMRDFFDRTPAERLALSRQTRKWIEEHHSYRSTARQLAELYETL